jgi:hypothetical protein
LNELLNRFTLQTIENNRLKVEKESLNKALEETIEEISRLKKQVEDL